MKQILLPDQVFTMITSKPSYDQSKTYRQSKYVVNLEYKNKYLLFNTLTREMLAFDKHEFENFNKNKSIYALLVEKRFYVENVLDEKELYDQIAVVLNSINRVNSINDFIIFPTMECNARCFYCFEHGTKRYPMTDDTAYAVADYIINKSDGKAVNLQWFGGEPLCNTKAIDIICNRLKEVGLTFKSKMISNGYLFDCNMSQYAKENWNVNLIQITLDGTRDVYNRIKNYIYKTSDSAFDKVINNIESALNNGIRVLIRINIGKENDSDVTELIEFLCNKFKGYEKLLSIYFVLLFENSGIHKEGRSLTERHILTKSLLEKDEYVCKHGFGLKATPEKKIRTNCCIADSDSSLTILPDGRIGKCEMCSDSKLIGDIYHDDIDAEVVAMWKIRDPHVKLCDDCPLYPQCIKLKECNGFIVHECDSIEQNRLIATLHRQMRYAYDKALKNQN